MVSAAALRDLHRIHRQLSDVKSRLTRGPKQIKAVEANVGSRVQELTRAKEALIKSRMISDEKELQLKEREAHILDVRAKLNSCSSNREYQALLEQIAADEQANSVLSDEILEMLDKIVVDQDRVTQSAADLAKGKQDLEKLKAKVTDERHSLEIDLVRLTEELRKAEGSLPADIRGDYDRVAKSRGEEALAPLEGECCGGCYQQVTSQMMNELQLSRIVFCKSCGRILYLPEDTSIG